MFFQMVGWMLTGLAVLIIFTLAICVVDYIKIKKRNKNQN